MKKKLLVTMLSVSLLSTVLVGCGNIGTGRQTDTEETDVETNQDEGKEQLESGKVSLRVWVEEANIENLQKMIDSFEQKYAGQADFDITIEVSADANTRTNVLGDIHNAADIFSMPDDQLYSMIAGGALSPVANQSEVKSANLPEAVDAASYNGTLYAYPYSADNGYFLYYNKAYLSNSDVQTMDRILEVAAENEKTLSMEFNSGWYLYSFFGNTGLAFGINDDGVTNYCNWNTTEGSIKGVDVTQALLDIATHPGFIAQPDGNFVEDMQSGTCIAGISGVWNAVAVQEAWGDNYAACKLPTYTCNGQQIQMASFVGYKMFGVNAYSEHLAWAHKLADWITNEENQILRFEERSTGPSNTVAAASDVVAKVPAIAAVIDQSQFGVLQRVGNSYWTACTTYADTIAAGNPDNMPLQDLVDRLVSGITASVVQ
ncbi:MAG: extracellular solute-binding protein [Lachnospiraceae bacterium]|nr:extracellular solute-binding protein [Lachnospiraceae bacterium]MDE7272366.1 extracellular solute-binding protein [Lachnospiraceae bacterium]